MEADVETGEIGGEDDDASPVGVEGDAACSQRLPRPVDDGRHIRNPQLL